MSFTPSSLRAWLGRRFGLRTESPEWRFDELLYSAISEFNDVLRVGHETRPEGAAQEKLRKRAEAAAAGFEALTPPNAEWADVVGDYRELAAIHLRYFGEVIPESAQREFAAINQRADLRREELRKAYGRHRGS